MSRFDVYRLKRRDEQLVVDLQASFLGDIGSRVVVPLARSTRLPRENLERLYPKIVIRDEEFRFVTPDMTSVLDQSLGEHVANIEASHRDDIVRAVDFLFEGH